MEHQQVIDFAFSDDEEVQKCWKDACKNFDYRIESIGKAKPVLDLLRATLPYKNDSISMTAHMAEWNPTYIFSIVRHVPLEMVIDLICGPLHRALGVDWKMEVNSYNVELHARHKEVSINVDVYEGDMQTCTLRKIPEAAHEPQNYVTYRYFMDCSEEA